MGSAAAMSGAEHHDAARCAAMMHADDLADAEDLRERPGRSRSRTRPRRHRSAQTRSDRSSASFDSSGSSRRGSVKATFTSAVDPSSDTTRMPVGTGRAALAPMLELARLRRRVRRGSRRSSPAGRRAAARLASSCACCASSAASCSAGAPAASACDGRRQLRLRRVKLCLPASSCAWPASSCAWPVLDLGAPVVDLAAARRRAASPPRTGRRPPRRREDPAHPRRGRGSARCCSSVNGEPSSVSKTTVPDRAAEVGKLLVQLVDDRRRTPCPGCRSWW